MTEKQYKKASKVVFISIAIIFGYIAVTLIAWHFSYANTSNWKMTLQLVTAILVIIASAVAHLYVEQREALGFPLLKNKG